MNANNEERTKMNSDGLITLTEERLRCIISDAYDLGFCDGDNCGYSDNDPYASRIIEALKKEVA